MTREDFAQKMAALAYFKELADARGLGFSGVDAYTRAFRVLDETYLAVFAPDRPLITLPMRMVGKYG